MTQQAEEVVGLMAAVVVVGLVVLMVTRSTRPGEYAKGEEVYTKDLKARLQAVRRGIIL